MANDEGLDWINRRKLIDWLEEGQSVGWRMHRFEYSLIMRALNYYVQHHNLNPVAQEVYDHIMLHADVSEISLEYPSTKAIRRLRGEEDNG